MSVDINELKSKDLGFFGVCGNLFKLGDSIFEALEDEDDGYRSYLGSIELRPEDKAYTFFSDPIATVQIKDLPPCSDEMNQEGFQIVDVEDGHVWLEVGTRNTDDYYPWFLFEYSPKVPA